MSEVTITIEDMESIGTFSVVELIAKLQSALDATPPEHRQSLIFSVGSYDEVWGTIEYDRPMTEAEISERDAAIARKIELEREAAITKVDETWLRNVRLATGIMDRTEAKAFIIGDPEASKFHPSVYSLPKISRD